MCSGGPVESAKRNLSPPDFIMDGEVLKPKNDSCNCSILLELSASDDFIGFKRAVEEPGFDSSAIDDASFWYGRGIGSKKMGFDQRTPLMIAAMFGSTEVLKYIISLGSVDVNQACGSDSATALHCAAAGGSLSSAEIVELLLGACADVNAVDANGKRPGDVIAKPFGNLRAKTLEMMLIGIISGGEKGGLANSDEQQLLLQKQEVLKDGAIEKKEYPVDLSLPDIKNGIYGTDEFRMYTFKVKPCSRAYSHDWTECPFVHPGENARRRDPRKYHYSCVPCPEFRKGACRNGDACEYAHGVFECWLHPAQYRTRLCKDETGCTRRVCFFAHKHEELRPLHPSTGSAVLSPRSSSSSVSPLDMAAMSPLTLGSPSKLMIATSTPPMSPSVSAAAMGGGSVWQNQLPPTLQLPGSRLKTALSARDIDFEMEMAGLEAYQQQQQQQQLMDDIVALAASSGSREYNRLGSLKSSNFEEFFGSLDPSVISQLQGLSLKSATAGQFQSSPSFQMRQNMTTPPRSGYSNLSSSSARTPSSFGLDSSLAAAVMSSRSAAFAKRSQSFCDRSPPNRHPGLTSRGLAASAPALSDWSSPDGKLDWGIQGEELNKLRKSASFGFRSNTTNTGITGVASMAASHAIDEPDVSWVNSLVKDVPQQHQQYHLNSGAPEFHASEMLSPWVEQLYMEQEQMVA
eukprot:TRINITY_DN858_c1_g1_i1.p1 TRINITY_DN858_c1_g1~~TRINITY_DN858_c1_g1_i1.p1  ORF type:complete len:687 (+),score=102.74 TRINITY_DN858_c1_g1_i1:126-2186(+)